MKMYLILIICFITETAAAQVTGKVLLKINAPAYSVEKIEVTKMNNLVMDHHLLATSSTNAKGAATISFNLAAPTFANIQIKNENFPVFISPGDTLLLIPGTDPARQQFKYKGSASEVNTYLKRVMLARLKYDMREGKPFFMQSTARFLQLRDSLKNELHVLFVDLAQRKKMPAALSDLLDFNNKMTVLAFEQTYTFGKDNSQIPQEIIKNGSQIPYSKAAVETAMPEFSMTITILLQTQIIIPEYASRSTLDSAVLNDGMPGFTSEKIMKSHYSKEIKTFLLGKNIVYWLALDGPTRPITEMFTEFKRQNPGSVLEPELESRFALWKSLEAGKQAPNFEGTQVDGKKTRLSSLSGKVVYIDVWATWCGPCKEEFPASKSLIEHFKDNTDITFLFLSIDKNVEAWKKSILAQTVPEGIHLNQNSTEDPNSVWKLYQLGAIPRYILIDKNGKIVDANAARPSSPTIVKQLTQLID